MVTIILAIALLAALAGLGAEIGIALWNIRRANVWLRGESAAERTAERAISERQSLEKQFELLDEYSSKISWLLNFLYKRYDKFADLEKEIDEKRKNADGDAFIGKTDGGYKDLKTAIKLIRTAVNTFGRTGWPVESMSVLAGQVLEDFYEAEKEGNSESPAPDKPGESEDESLPESEAPNS
jgi:hypothetical protein